jgi:hypothetical protein
MPGEPPTLTRRSFLSAAAAGIISSPIWAKAITARVSDSQLLSNIEVVRRRLGQRQVAD